MRAFRRGLFVISLAALVGMVLRLRGQGGAPPVTGGWRELRGPDFR